MYCLAITLSSALQTPSSDSKNSSLNVFSVSSPTRSIYSLIFILWFIFFAALAATFDLCSPTSLFRNKNCLFKFDFSIVSISVIRISPFSPQPRPIMAKFLIYSQPSAPEPTRKYLRFSIFF